jgi:hypothetical protein
MHVFEKIIPVVLRFERLGSRILPNGVELIGHVPHRGPHAFLHLTFPPLNDHDTRDIEQQIGCPLPYELKEFYSYTNGLDLFSCSLAIYGLRRSFARSGDEARQPFSIVTPNTIERPLTLPGSVVIFGSYEWDGSTLGMSPECPTVYRFAPNSVEVLSEWPTFEEMLLREVDRLSALFDAKGRKLDEDAPTTPEPQIRVE